MIFKLTYNILKFYYVPDPEGNLNIFQKTNTCRKLSLNSMQLKIDLKYIIVEHHMFGS